MQIQMAYVNECYLCELYLDSDRDTKYYYDNSISLSTKEREYRSNVDISANVQRIIIAILGCKILVPQKASMKAQMKHARINMKLHA